MPVHLYGCMHGLQMMMIAEISNLQNKNVVMCVYLSVCMHVHGCGYNYYVAI